MDGDLVETFLELDRPLLEQVVRTMNDELATIHANATTGSSTTATAAVGAGSLANGGALHGMLSGDVNKSFKPWSVEDCVRRVEEMSRVH